MPKIKPFPGIHPSPEIAAKVALQLENLSLDEAKTIRQENPYSYVNMLVPRILKPWSVSSLSRRNSTVSPQRILIWSGENRNRSAVTRTVTVRPCANGQVAIPTISTAAIVSLRMGTRRLKTTSRAPR